MEIKVLTMNYKYIMIKNNLFVLSLSEHSYNKYFDIRNSKSKGKVLEFL